LRRAAASKSDIALASAGSDGLIGKEGVGCSDSFLSVWETGDGTCSLDVGMSVGVGIQLLMWSGVHMYVILLIAIWRPDGSQADDGGFWRSVEWKLTDI
jgi:hypothetical protein